MVGGQGVAGQRRETGQKEDASGRHCFFVRMIRLLPEVKVDGSGRSFQGKFLCAERKLEMNICGALKRLTHDWEWVYESTKWIGREKEKGEEINGHAPLLFILWDNGDRDCRDPLYVGHVTTSLSQNGNCLLFTAWWDNGGLGK